MLVDRNELEASFSRISPAMASPSQSGGEQAGLAAHPAGGFSGAGGLHGHKFDDMPADMNPRKNIIVLVDEAHRTTGGDLGNYLMAALPNATYIGFTGTPLTSSPRGRAPSRSSGGR